ncbi:antirestriction protein [Sphingobium sp. YBL2]|uniref:antirestriction protein n=1 Tax=Sphingobium sp. (strain YBL2) TaxID=484429 RepID=UPI0005CC6B65|nr:antirestriction protein [Sphingobium sp. YBL2]AJR26826.1 antirestriction protein [Sphingobium sp. YBL2]
MSLPISAPEAVTIVPEHRRSAFLPALFGRCHFFMAETMVYNFLSLFSPDYRGGYWKFLEAGGRPLYLAPAGQETYRICCQGNGYTGMLSADAAGIVATLFTFSHLSFEVEDDHIVEVFHRLRAFAGDRVEATKIFSAID